MGGHGRHPRGGHFKVVYIFIGDTGDSGDSLIKPARGLGFAAPRPVSASKTASGDSGDKLTETAQGLRFSLPWAVPTGETASRNSAPQPLQRIAQLHGASSFSPSRKLLLMQ